jgi:hypothetical protein
MDMTLALAVNIVVNAIRPPTAPAPEPVFCINECPAPGDGFGELGKMRQTLAGLVSSSAISAHWQIGVTTPNISPFLP